MAEIVLEGCLLHSPRGNIRFVTAGTCLEFHRDDVCDVQERPLPPGVTPGIGITVCLTLRTGAALLDAYSAAPFEDALQKGRSPFAFAARQRRAEVPECPRYRALEREYLQRHNLQAPPDESSEPL